MSKKPDEAPKKKSFWDILNTPVQDLFKEGAASKPEDKTQQAASPAPTTPSTAQSAVAEAGQVASEQAQAASLAAEKAQAQKQSTGQAAEQAHQQAEKAAAAKAEAERQAAEQAQQAKQERQQAEKAKAEAAAAAAQAEQEHLAAEKAQAERLAQAESEKIAAQQAATEKAAAEAAQKIAEQQAAEKIKAEAAAQAAAEKAEQQRQAAEQAEQARQQSEQQAAAKAEAERLAAEQAAAEQKAADEAEEERLLAEKAKAEQQAAEAAAAEKQALESVAPEPESLEEPVAEAAAEAEAPTKKKVKKGLWEILNTPVQDLFKEDGLLVEVDANASEEEQEAQRRRLAWLGLGREKPDLEGQEKASWLQHFRNRLAKTRGEFAESIYRLAKGRTKVDEDMLEELEEILLQSDVGVDTTDDILDFLRAEAKKRRLLPEEVLPTLSTYLEETLESEPFRVESGRLNIFLVVGVNGTGKTTTVGKIAAKLRISGYKVMLAAGDTFRAAAIDQLAVWAKRANCPLIQHHEGADAAAVVYDAIQSARAKKVDALLIDTAGRLHNKDHLMEELKKVHRIIEREQQDARLERLLVLDATTGQNGLRQAEVFSKAVPLDGLIITKLDGTAKGGVMFAIKKAMGIPIRLLGVGEHLGDLQEFEPKAFVQTLFAREESLESNDDSKTAVEA